MTEPYLVAVIRRLADLEDQGYLNPSELAELNGLRAELQDRWPQVARAIVAAYVAQGRGRQVTDDDKRARINQPGGLLNPGWFRIQSGEHEGRWHISGWTGSALLLGDGTYYSFGICPVCQTMVPSEPALSKNAYGDRTWAHEQWHARTDFPIPEEGER